MVLATKCDIAADPSEEVTPGMQPREVTKEEGEELARALALFSKEDSDSEPVESLFFEVSAKTAKGIDQALDELTRAVRREELLASKRTADRHKEMRGKRLLKMLTCGCAIC